MSRSGKFFVVNDDNRTDYFNPCTCAWGNNSNNKLMSIQKFFETTPTFGLTTQLFCFDCFWIETSSPTSQSFHFLKVFAELC